MKAWLLSLALAAPMGLLAAEAPAPPVVAAPEVAPDPAPAAVPAASTETVRVITAPVAVAAATPEPAAGAIQMSPKDPKAAFKAALWPDLLLHGWGHHVAGDQDTFLNLAGGELFGLVMLGFGLAEALGPDIKGESKATSQAIAMAGGAIFATTWIWDLVDAGAAARRFNQEHDLGLAPLDGGARLAYTTRF